MMGKKGTRAQLMIGGMGESNEILASFESLWKQWLLIRIGSWPALKNFESTFESTFERPLKVPIDSNWSLAGFENL